MSPGCREGEEISLISSEVNYKRRAKIYFPVSVVFSVTWHYIAALIWDVTSHTPHIWYDFFSVCKFNDDPFSWWLGPIFEPFIPTSASLLTLIVTIASLGSTVYRLSTLMRIWLDHRNIAGQITEP